MATWQNDMYGFGQGIGHDAASLWHHVAGVFGGA